MELDYAAPRSIDDAATVSGVCAFIGICGAIGFAVFIAIDVLLVRFAPTHVTDYDWASLLFPVAVGVAGLYRFRRTPVGRRVGLSVLSALLASVLVIALMVVPGIWIHLAVGGTF